VIAIPLIGAIDSTRAQQILETLLDGITARGASVAILDITGVKVVDAQVANALIGAAQAARLLGAEVVLTGIGSEVAQTEALDHAVTLCARRGVDQVGLSHATRDRGLSSGCTGGLGRRPELRSWAARPPQATVLAPPLDAHRRRQVLASRERARLRAL